MNERKYRPSNGCEGAGFMDRFCAQCKRDEAFQKDPANNDGCDIAARTMAYNIDDPEYPSEWTIDDNGCAKCTSFDRIEPDAARHD